MRHLVVIFLAATMLAGCLGSQAPGGSGPTNATDDGADPVGQPGGADPGPASTGHVHDLWDGRSTLTLVDREVPMEAFQAGAEQVASPETAVRGCYSDPALIPFPTCLGYASFRPDSSDGDRRLVPPGTAAIRATISWESPTVTGVELRFEPAFETGWRSLGVASSSGETIVVQASERFPTRDSFPLSWTDDGHAQASRWEFGAAAYAGDSFAAVADGSVQIQIEVVRTEGDLPVEPPHPDWYGETSTYRLASAQRNVTEAWETTYVWWWNQWQYMISLAPENPVPPGTREVVFEVDVTDNSPIPATPATETRVDLFYAHDGEYIGPYGDEGRTAEGSQEGGTWTFRIPVEPRTTDSLYTCGPRESLWRFLVWVHPPSVQDPVFEARHPSAMHFEGSIGVDGVATTTTGKAIDDLSPADASFPDGCGEVVADA